MEFPRLGCAGVGGQPTLEGAALVVGLLCLRIELRQLLPGARSLGARRHQIFEVADCRGVFSKLRNAEPAETLVEARGEVGRREFELGVEHIPQRGPIFAQLQNGSEPVQNIGARVRVGWLKKQLAVRIPRLVAALGKSFEDPSTLGVDSKTTRRIDGPSRALRQHLDQQSVVLPSAHVLLELGECIGMVECAGTRREQRVRRLAPLLQMLGANPRLLARQLESLRRFGRQRRPSPRKPRRQILEVAGPRQEDLQSEPQVRGRARFGVELHQDPDARLQVVEPVDVDRGQLVQARFALGGVEEPGQGLSNLGELEEAFGLLQERDQTLEDPAIVRFDLERTLVAGEGLFLPAQPQVGLRHADFVARPSRPLEEWVERPQRLAKFLLPTESFLEPSEGLQGFAVAVAFPCASMGPLDGFLGAARLLQQGNQLAGDLPALAGISGGSRLRDAAPNPPLLRRNVAIQSSQPFLRASFLRIEIECFPIGTRRPLDVIEVSFEEFPELQRDPNASFRIPEAPETLKHRAQLGPVFGLAMKLAERGEGLDQ